MDSKQIIDALGGRKAVIELTGLTRGRIHQWISTNDIPRPWLLLFRERLPDLDWKSVELDTDQRAS